MSRTPLKIIIASLSIASVSAAMAAATPYDVQLSVLGQFVATSPVGVHKTLELIRPFTVSKNGDHADALVTVTAIRGKTACAYEGFIAYEPAEHQSKLLAYDTGAKIASLHRPFSGTTPCSQLKMSVTGLVTYELEAITKEYVLGQKVARGAEQERQISARMGEPFSFGDRTAHLKPTPVAAAPAPPPIRVAAKPAYPPIQIAAKPAPIKIVAIAAPKPATPLDSPADKVMVELSHSNGVALVATPKTGRVVVRASTHGNAPVVAAISGTMELTLETCDCKGWLKWNNLGYIKTTDINLVTPAAANL